MSYFNRLKENLKSKPKNWLITGVSGFIGSNLLEALLLLDQNVIGIDNFSTGTRKNLDDVKLQVADQQWNSFEFIDGDVCDFELCLEHSSNVDYILHQAALGSVPRSIKNPIRTNHNNISGFLNMLQAAKENKVNSFVYAASSSTYGDHKSLPKIEEVIGNPLSPYAVSKYANELYADVFSRCYDYHSIGLRYFNVFGKRQSPNGAYAAVIPKWMHALINDLEVEINGDGKTSRDFCYIENVVEANILAATTEIQDSSEVLNIAFGEETSLNELFELMRLELNGNGLNYDKAPVYRDFRPGDVRHSLASIEKARKLIGYSPKYDIRVGIRNSMPWFIEELQ